MGRKAKREKQTVQVVVDGVPIAVILHPPGGKHKSWYVYWHGLPTSRSTGQPKLIDAIAAAEKMVKGWKAGLAGKRAVIGDNVMTDEEFIEVQKAFYGRHGDEDAAKRSAKTLCECLHAITACQLVIRMDPINYNGAIAAITPDICAAFQRKALTLAKNWRKPPTKRKTPEEMMPRLSDNTVITWSTALKAAFNRVNRNAGKRCVRGVVPAEKLLTENPWDQFPWIAGHKKPIRQFDKDELLGFPAFLTAGWPGITSAVSLSKVLLWSQSRREEATTLAWPQLRAFGDEYHFQVVGKHNVKKWFRIPPDLYQELLAIRTESPYVFEAYNNQLREHWKHSNRPWQVANVAKEFQPSHLAAWLTLRLAEWSATLPKGHASMHVFRKTGLQQAMRGHGKASRQVAKDARVSEHVMLGHYVEPDDPERREESNRTYERIAAALPAEVATVYGLVVPTLDEIQTSLDAAIAAQDWILAGRLKTEFDRRKGQG